MRCSTPAAERWRSARVATRAACCERRLGSFFTALTECRQRLLRGHDLLFESGALHFEDFNVRLASAENAFLLGPFRCQSLQFELAHI